MDSTPPNIFHLTETPFFESLRQGLQAEDIHIRLRDFIVRVQEVSNPTNGDPSFILDMLVLTEIELQVLRNSERMAKANAAIALAVEKAHGFLCHKMEQVRHAMPPFQSIPAEDSISDVSLEWKGDKTQFVMLCHALQVSKFFGKASRASILKVLGKALNVKVDQAYANNRINALPSLGLKSVTSVLDHMKTCVQQRILGEDVPVTDLASL